MEYAKLDIPQEQITKNFEFWMRHKMLWKGVGNSVEGLSDVEHFTKRHVRFGVVLGLFGAKIMKLMGI